MTRLLFVLMLTITQLSAAASLKDHWKSLRHGEVIVADGHYLKKRFFRKLVLALENEGHTLSIPSESNWVIVTLELDGQRLQFSLVGPGEENLRALGPFSQYELYITDYAARVVLRPDGGLRFLLGIAVSDREIGDGLLFTDEIKIDLHRSGKIESMRGERWFFNPDLTLLGQREWILKDKWPPDCKTL